MRARSGQALAIAGLLVAAGSPAPASQIAHDAFRRSFPIYANSGTGFAGAWTQGGFNAFASGYEPADESLCFGSLETGGGSVAGGAFPAINGALRVLAQQQGQDGTTIYVSFLVEAREPFGSGIFSGFFGLTLNGSLGNDLFIGKSGGGALAEWVLETRGGGGQVASGAPITPGETALLVVKAEFLAGNDVFTLYVDPPPGGAEPGSGAEKADLNLGLVPRIGIYSSGPFAIDEIRIGTTYADVVRGVRSRRCSSRPPGSRPTGRSVP